MTKYVNVTSKSKSNKHGLITGPDKTIASLRREPVIGPCFMLLLLLLLVILWRILSYTAVPPAAATAPPAVAAAAAAAATAVASVH